MQIAGIQKFTMLDYPGMIAATVFTRGCSFRCPFCHNPELVQPDHFNPLYSDEEIFEFFEKRKKQIQGVCITGGEPTLQADIIEFIKKLKDLGYKVKLDSNGWSPEILEKIIKEGIVNYIAMDIKASPDKYRLASGCHSGLDPESRNNAVISTHSEPTAGWTEEGEKSQHEGEDVMLENIKKSIKLIMKSGIDYEFRTTVVHPIHEIADFEEIGKLIKGAKRYFIQNFVPSKHNDETIPFKPFTDKELNESKQIMGKYIKEVEAR